MEFRIADTFTSSLGRLTNEEQKSVKTTVFDLQLNPANPGMQFHRIDKSKDTNFWSLRVSQDIRLIVHKTQASFLICYVDHHDKAYQWAERRKIEQHPKTGAAQIVELRESVKEIIIPKYVESQETIIAPIIQQQQKPLFSHLPKDTLLSYGVPTEWINEVLLATEDSLFQIASHLPQEAAEALLELATGGTPSVPQSVTITNPFEHPDAKRRFTSIKTSEELAKALDYPWDKWTVFLHPDQRTIVEKNYSGAARVSGSAGTGKTIVAIHRAVNLAKRDPDARVLLTTFSETLATSLLDRVRRLIADQPRLGDRIEVHALDTVASNFYRKLNSKNALASEQDIRAAAIKALTESPALKLSLPFVMSEWKDIVDAWNIKDEEAYLKANRLGRRRRLSDQQRNSLWKVFESIRTELCSRSLHTKGEMYADIAEYVAGFKNPPYEFVIVDEAQDISIPQLRFLTAIGRSRPNALFFAGDLGQRIFQQPFSWKSIGVDIRGRSQTLKVNYRTSHQIRKHADLLLAGAISDVDGNMESRKGTISAFDGIAPEIKTLKTEADEVITVSKWLESIAQNGTQPQEVAIFVRSEAQVPRAIKAVEAAHLRHSSLDEHVAVLPGRISIAPMHLAKGLEFKAVAVMACDDEIIPLQERIETAADESELDEVYQSERHLLYVACTRARDALLVTGVDPASEFLEDLAQKNDRR